MWLDPESACVEVYDMRSGTLQLQKALGLSDDPLVQSDVALVWSTYSRLLVRISAWINRPEAAVMWNSESSERLLVLQLC